MLLRCPGAKHSACFFQKHVAAFNDPYFHTLTVDGKDYIYIDHLPGLISLEQLGALKLHTWGSQISHLETPDQIVLDLDPDFGLPWQHVVSTAQRLRSYFDKIGFNSFVKTSGGKGWHVVVPLKPSANWDAVKTSAKLAAAQQLLRPIR